MRKKVFKLKKIKYIIFLVILLGLFLLVSAVSYASTISKDLSENFFRLHILANSDSKEDQELKLKVRDAVISYMETLSYEGLTKNEAVILTTEHLEDFKNIAKQVIEENNYNYDVNLEVGNFYFPTKEYGNISLPAGFYDGLKIEIGEANGQNWWCSLFPPLCFVDISSGVIDETAENELKENLSDEEFAIITGDSEEVKLKFKLLELLSN